MTEIRFEGPPPLKRGPGRKQNNDISEALRNRPGEWAVVKVTRTISAGTSAANYIRNAKSSVYAPAGSFEAVFRSVHGEHRVYARYVGKDGA